MTPSSSPAPDTCSSGEDADFSAWVGRSESRQNVLEPDRVNALEASLGRAPTLQVGQALPLLRHWLYFWNVVPPHQLGVDGHPKVGGFMPPSGLPRRMWAGGRLTFLHPLQVGDTVQRRSSILRVEARAGRTSNLLFVTVQHELVGSKGLALLEEQDIVYLEIVPGGTPVSPPLESTPAAWHRRVDVDPVLLFRYSALTMNGHRIHYDAAYARDQEAYPGLVVHGPLQATLLADLAQDHSSTPLRSFEFRGRGPAFAGRMLNVSGNPKPKGGDLWTDQGGLALMTASFAH